MNRKLATFINLLTEPINIPTDGSVTTCFVYYRKYYIPQITKYSNILLTSRQVSNRDHGTKGLVRVELKCPGNWCCSILIIRLLYLVGDRDDCAEGRVRAGQGGGVHGPHQNSLETTQVGLCQILQIRDGPDVKLPRYCRILIC